MSYSTQKQKTRVISELNANLHMVVEGKREAEK